MGARRDTHEDFSRDETVTGSSDRGFGIVFAVVFTIVGLWPLTGDRDPRWWSVALAAAFLLAALLRPGVLAPLNRLWTRFGLLLHKIVNPLVMGLMFFVVITPMGIVMRMAGKDPMRLRRDGAASTYWIAREPPGPEPQSMKNQF
ncbi:MAG: SxtJ family membrane protein [Alphaproteobacteria bacterium]